MNLAKRLVSSRFPLSLIIIPATRTIRFVQVAESARVYSSVVYPHNYGFIPRTLGTVLPRCFLGFKAIGLIGRERRQDNCSSVDDPEYRNYNVINQLPPHRLAEFVAFLKNTRRMRTSS
ncbi:hypothetical protein SAY87_024017 [Trapa incisa]|uniref:inorganic diphosphatase n=1 Tax=Trapa incisa TaxID=236973 RepID=A0AAN7QSP8_9MYRT|nr:hypothetical protein SAY87_024017 [Trapa incisa]